MDYILSQVVYMPFNWTMMYFVPCRGQIFNIRDNQALFALIGTKFGGDGHTTFALPDLRPWDISAPDTGLKIRREWHDDELVPHMCVQGIFPNRE